MVELHDEEGAKQKVRGYLDSHEWWMLIEPDAGGWMTTLENRFYSGEANADFHLLLLPGVPELPLISALCFGKKTRCTPDQMSAFLCEQSSEYAAMVAAGGGAPDLTEQDILVLAHHPERWAYIPAALASWLGYLKEQRG